MWPGGGAGGHHRLTTVGVGPIPCHHGPAEPAPREVGGAVSRRRRSRGGVAGHLGHGALVGVAVRVGVAAARARAGGGVDPAAATDEEAATPLWAGPTFALATTVGVLSRRGRGKHQAQPRLVPNTTLIMSVLGNKRVTFSIFSIPPLAKQYFKTIVTLRRQKVKF